ncbi:MAG TPA: hypothetical protein VEB41_11265 [Burkholderiales bacterium]|nr:hypothetical protein [Burkholderiales bacterium]
MNRLAPLAIIAAQVAALVAALPARAEPYNDPQRAQAAWIQAEQQRRLDRAAEQCRVNRGTDCSTPEGLNEWLLNDRSRAEAVLDRVAPITVAPPLVVGGGSASTGASAPPAIQTQPSPGEQSPREPRPEVRR